jgi:hypothetical protein
MNLEISYSVEFDWKSEKDILSKVLKNAEELGYSYGDAGKEETIKRFLISEGIENVFPESEIDRNLIKVSSHCLSR